MVGEQSHGRKPRGILSLQHFKTFQHKHLTQCWHELLVTKNIGLEFPIIGNLIIEYL